jgi:catechol 2,3-dioxygenase-like lactoylglutathione lyase family enzyme
VQFEDSCPVILTEQLAECRDFYQRWFGFTVVFEAEWFVLLTCDGSRPVSIAFMHPDHPSTPPAPGAFTGDGMFLTFQVADVRADYERLLAEGLQPALMLRDEPWGQRRFAVVDPAGVWLDIVEQVEPEPGWWDQYLPK